MPIAYNPETGQALLMGADGKMAPTPTAKNSLGDVMALDHDGKMVLVYQSPKSKEAVDKRSEHYGMTDQIVNSLPFAKDVAGLAHALPVSALWGQAPEGTFGERFKQGKNIENAAEARYSAEHPYKNIAANVLGALVAGSPARSAAMTLAPGATPAATALGRAAENAGVGATFGAISGVGNSNADTLEGRAKDFAAGALTGGVAGAAMPAVVNTAAGMISPQMRESLRQIVAGGGKPTIGQIIGAPANAIEEKATQVPIVGDVIRNARQRSVAAWEEAQQKALQGWRTNTINEALAPIGETVAPGLTGRQAIEDMSKKASAAYDKLLPKMKVTADPQFNNDFLGVLSGNRAELSPDGQKKLAGILDKEVFSQFDNHAGMTGETFKKVEGALKEKISKYKGALGAEDQSIGEGLEDTLGHLKALQMRSNPTLATDLQKANAAFARTKVVQRAADNATAEGAFTPEQMLMAAKVKDRGRGNFSSGKAMMQPAAQAGRDVAQANQQIGATQLGGIGKEPNDIFGAPLEAGLLAGAHALGHPTLALGAGAAGLGAMGLYSPWGQGIARGLLTTRQGPAWQAAAQQLRALTPQASAIGGNIAGKTLPGIW